MDSDDTRTERNASTCNLARAYASPYRAPRDGVSWPAAPHRPALLVEFTR